MSGETVITLIGNLTADPELKVFDSGKAVANFTIASTPRSFDKESGGWKDGEALFMRCQAWDPLASNIVDSLSKGDRVIASGRLAQRSYETNGEKRTVMECTVDEIGAALRFAVAKVTRADRNGSSSSSRKERMSSSKDSAPSAGGYDDEPPF